MKTAKLKLSLLGLALFGAGCFSTAPKTAQSFCSASVVGVADCGTYVQTIAANPNGTLNFVNASNGSKINCTMDTTSQSAQCKQILAACKPFISCPLK